MFRIALKSLYFLLFVTASASGVEFAPAVTNIPPFTASRMATADINEDNKLDLLILGDGPSFSYATIYHGSGDGSFHLNTNHQIAKDPFEFAVKDLNQDGILDFIFTYSFSYCVSLGQEDGSYTAQICYPVDGQPIDVIIADYDSDGIEDLICPGSTMSIRPGLGNGQFGVLTNHYVAGGDNRLAAFRDFDGDGLMDVIRTMNAPSSTSLLLINKGSAPAVYTNSQELPISFRPERFAIADFNNNEHLDVLLLASSRPLLLITNDGHGYFSFAETNAVARAFILSQPVIADFDGDGLKDVALSYYYNSKSADVFINQGDRFSPPVSNAIGDLAGSIVVGDFDEDDRPDLIAASYSPRQFCSSETLQDQTWRLRMTLKGWQ